MAPVKVLSKALPSPAKHCTKTRSQHSLKKEIRPKRKAEESPMKRLTTKRAPIGEVTNVHLSKETAPKSKMAFHKVSTVTKVVNALAQKTNNEPKDNEKVVDPSKSQKTKTRIPMPANKENVSMPKKSICVKPNEKPVRKPLGNQSTINIKTENVHKSLEMKVPPKKPLEPITRCGVVTRSSITRKSTESEKSDSSLYVSALDDLCLEDNAQKRDKKKRDKKLPRGVEDYDKELIKEIDSVATYAMDIFDYLKSREKFFIIQDYLPVQNGITLKMRELVVDWMVELQESFELNHETLYLGVKLFDLYLSKKSIQKEKLQLAACTSLFIAAKYDERMPPSIDDFLDVCDGLYTISDILDLEVSLLKSIDFHLGVPISYRFLRRYARCAKISLPILTLARYILEYNLMNYDCIKLSDSKMAAASLLMARLMSKTGKWNPTLEYYSGYKVSDFVDICYQFNSFLKLEKNHLKTIRNKYSHECFFKVAKTALIDSFES